MCGPTPPLCSPAGLEWVFLQEAVLDGIGHHGGDGALSTQPRIVRHRPRALLNPPAGQSLGGGCVLGRASELELIGDREMKRSHEVRDDHALVQVGQRSRAHAQEVTGLFVGASLRKALIP